MKHLAFGCKSFAFVVRRNFRLKQTPRNSLGMSWMNILTGNIPCRNAMFLKASVVHCEVTVTRKKYLL